MSAVNTPRPPVAVVALLKELGLSGLLPVGIEGESLLNDGTALVIFTVLRQMVQLPFATVRAAAARTTRSTDKASTRLRAVERK